MMWNRQHFIPVVCADALIGIAAALSPPQALLHPYFFSSPLPAHHSELPIPRRGGRPPRQRLQAPPTDFWVDLPLQNSVVDPELLRGHSACL